MGMDREPHVERWWAFETKCHGRDGLQATEALLLRNLVFPSRYLPPQTPTCAHLPPKEAFTCAGLFSLRKTLYFLSLSLFFFFFW